MIDNYAYLKHAHGDVPMLDQLVAGWMPTYDAVVLVPITEAPGADGIRAADPVFQRSIETMVMAELDNRGIAFHDLRDSPRSAWLDEIEAFAIERLRPPQLPLGL